MRTGPLRPAHPTAAVYVCICNGVTDHQIREAATNGVRTVAELTMRTGCGATCGSCLDMAGSLLDAHHARAEREFSLPILGLSQAA
ncbi:MAG TPA: (2Fe-2S)-binding protein [Burkholderiaceae bacterium]|nr:(2Fe-2S)-binding protein [Burkholderiaceae bacterium]